MKKICVVGAGRVGETSALMLAQKGLCQEVNLYDLRANAAAGAALDIMQSASYFGFDTRVSGGSDAELIRDSDLVIITAGSPRKPGMSRSDVLDVNRAVIDTIVDHSFPILEQLGDRIEPLGMHQVDRHDVQRGRHANARIRAQEGAHEIEPGRAVVQAAVDVGGLDIDEARSTERLAVALQQTHRALRRGAEITGQQGLVDRFQEHGIRGRGKLGEQFTLTPPESLVKIDRIELFHVAVPLPKPFHPAWIPGYPQTLNRFTLARITTDEGAQGLAAGAAFNREREGLGELLGPYLIGLDPTDIETGRQRIREAGYLGWRNYWLEAAFWDVRGKVEGKPLWQLLGGDASALRSKRLPVYASTGEVHPPERRAEEVLGLYEAGFRTVKLRVHSFDEAEDIAQVETVRRAVGERMAIGVDANQGWRVALVDDAPLWDLPRATRFAEACAGLDVAWLEEPLDMYAWDELAELRRRARVPIAGGELNGGWHEFAVMLEKGCFDLYQPDATFGGGISDAVRVARACRERGLAFSPHTWSNGFSMMVNLHVHAACGDEDLVAEIDLFLA